MSAIFSNFSDRLTSSFFFRNAASSLVAFAVVFAVAQWWKTVEEKKQAAEFDVTLLVHSAPQGEEPKIDYTRIIREDHVGNWFVKVRRVGKVGNVCEGAGPGTYTTDSTGTITVDLEWYVGKDCQLGPGTYYIRTQWELSDEQGNKKTYVRRSNTFEITRDSQ